MAPMFLKCNYDIIITDYRQHGKSTGEITIDNFYSDSQTVYDFLKTKYPENKIVVVGYSLGTSIASHLAIDNNPLMTILVEPREKFADKYLEILFFPLPQINKFPFRTDLDIQKTKKLDCYYLWDKECSS
jgi:pimeloyl-ACP methyl ester carboxylesterase